MRKIQTMTISGFMNGAYKNDDGMIKKFTLHLERNHIAYKVIGTTLIIFVAGGLDGSALASSGIDEGAKKIYYKMVNIGKWVIICKGGWDTIQSTVQGDFDSAKKRFISYLLVYLILLGLPWAMDEVDNLFNEMA
jgi:hypothetical protein